MRGGLPRKHDFRSTRRWKTLRLRILHRDLWQCQIRGPRCLGKANEADHITPPRGDETLQWAEWNLRGACAPCNNGRNNPALEAATVATPSIRFFRDSAQNRAPLATLSPFKAYDALTGDYSRRPADDDDR